MPSPGDFEFHDPSGGIDRDHKCYVTGWGRRTESKPFLLLVYLVGSSAAPTKHIFFSSPNLISYYSQCDGAHMYDVVDDVRIGIA